MRTSKPILKIISCFSFLVTFTAALAAVAYLQMSVSYITIVEHVGFFDATEWVVEKVISKRERQRIDYLPTGVLTKAGPNDYWSRQKPYSGAASEKVVRAISVEQINEELSTHQADYKNWHRSNGDYFSTKFSKLNLINQKNVSSLRPKWIYNSGEGEWECCGESTFLNSETNPVFADGALFVTTPGLYLVAIDVETGVERWRFKAPGIPARRGLLYIPKQGDAPARLIVSFSNRLYVINPATGKPLKEFGQNGRVKTGKSLIAPVVFDNNIIIATTKPALEAYNLNSGEKVWETPLLKPIDEKIDIETTPSIKGGVPWGGMSLDPSLEMVFVTTGNARASLFGALRPGDNLHSNSVVAINARNGEIVWAFQEVSHDLWDYDIPSPPILTSIQKDSKTIDVVVAVTKIGNTIILERNSGKPIFDFLLKKATPSDVPGEKAAIYQPNVQTPEPFSKTTFARSDVTDIGENNTLDVLAKIKGSRMGFFAPPTIGQTLVSFGLHGGAQWPGAALDPSMETIFVPSSQIPWISYLEFTNPKGITVEHDGKQIFKENCARCHGADRAGSTKSRRPISEQLSSIKNEVWSTSPPIPSLIGISFARENSLLRDFEKFSDKHRESEIDNITDQLYSKIVDYFVAEDREIDASGGMSYGYHWEQLVDYEGFPGSKPPWGQLTAINLSSGKIIWQRPFGEYEDLSKRGIQVTGQANYGGAIATAGGLVFATGTPDKRIRAFNSFTGEELWSFELPAGGSAPPTTFFHDGAQYLVVVANGPRFRGFDRSDAVILFELGND